jgi:hypothetical protein
MDAYKAAPLPDKPLKCRLLVEIENITGGIEKNHYAIPGQVLRRKDRCIFTGLDLKVMLRSQGPERRDPGRNRLVTKCRSLGKNQCRKRGLWTRCVHGNALLLPAQ